MNRRKPIRHGTGGGYRAHSRHGEPMCEPCREHERQRRGRRPFTPARCGTRSGYHRHLIAGEPSCDPCRRAASEAHRQLIASKTGLPPGDPRHGTTAGYSYWRCRCPECTAANTAASRARRGRS